VAKLFITQTEPAATKIIDDMGFNTKYVIIDYDTVTSKFYALPEWAGDTQEQFYETYYYRKENGQLAAGQCFYPEYYRTLVARLYNFDGRSVVPDVATVISYEEKFNPYIGAYKEIVAAKSFDNYAEAEAYVSSQKSGNHHIVGVDPFASPVPLSELQDFKLVYSSEESKNLPNTKSMPEVKVFEYMAR